MSCADSAHSAAAVRVLRASGLRGLRPVGPRMPNRGPMKLSPGTSAATAYNVWRAPKSASVAIRFAALQNLSPVTLPVWPCRLVAEYPGCAATARTGEPAAVRLRCNSLVNSRLASLDCP